MNKHLHHRAPLIAHFAEFRNRLMIVCVSWLAASVFCYLMAPHIYAFLVQPLAHAFDDPSSRRLIYTGLAEAFFTYMKLAIFGGFLLTFPVLAWQFYLFLAPGLYKRERWVLLPYLIAAPLLFFAGAALAYYYIFPLAWKFFVSFETAALPGSLPVQLEARVGEYLSLVMQVILAFGLAFQLPIALTLLARVGVVHSQALAKGRRYAVVILLTAAAILTPPDIISQIGLFVPLYLLYEISIFACRLIEKQHTYEELNHHA